MNIEELKKDMLGSGSNIGFIYNGKNCGIESEFKDGTPTFEVWYGNDIKTHNEFDTMIYDKFFGGQSLADLLNKIDIDFY